jgi:hypothetical protein
LGKRRRAKGADLPRTCTVPEGGPSSPKGEWPMTR